MAKDGYKKIYQYLNDKHSKQEDFTLEALAVFAGYKLQSLLVYNRNKLRNRFIKERENNKYYVLDEIENFNEKEFIEFISQKKIDHEESYDLNDYLRENSIQALLAAIEIHNKPSIPYRYQIVSILIVNSWELLLKAFLVKYHPRINIFQKEGTTKPFEQIMNSVIDQLGKEYFHIREDLKLLYKFRCDYIHYYKENIDPLLFGLFQKAIINYNTFSTKFFKFKLDEIDDLYILPIGFKSPISPIDYLTNKSTLKNTSEELKQFLLHIIDTTNKLNDDDIQETVIVPFALLYKNEKRLKNADIVAAILGNKDITLKVSQEFKITDKEGSKEVKINEEIIYDEIFTETYTDVVTYCKSHIAVWKQNSTFHSFMKLLKKDKKLHKIRYLNPNNPGSTKQSFYSKEIYARLEENYRKKEGIGNE